MRDPMPEWVGSALLIVLMVLSVSLWFYWRAGDDCRRAFARAHTAAESARVEAPCAHPSRTR